MANADGEERLDLTGPVWSDGTPSTAKDRTGFTMLSMGQRTADFLLRWRWQVIVIYAMLTGFFSVGVMRIAHRFQAQTSVADLIPAHNRVTDVFKRYQSFSKPATVEILLKVKSGTIYTPQTLARIWRITRELDLVRVSTT